MMTERISDVKEFCQKKIWGKLENGLDGLKKYLQESVEEGNTAYEVEKNIWERILEIGVTGIALKQRLQCNQYFSPRRTRRTRRKKGK